MKTVNIRRLLTSSKRVLFTDTDYFNRDITGCKSLADIKDLFTIRGNLKLLAEVGNTRVYGSGGRYGYNFTLKFLDY